MSVLKWQWRGEFLKFESSGGSPPVPSDSTKENQDFDIVVVVGVSKKKQCLLYTSFECNSCNQTGTLLKDCKNDLFFMKPLSRKIPPISSCLTIGPQSITEKKICHNMRFMVHYTQHIYVIKMHQNCITYSGI